MAEREHEGRTFAMEAGERRPDGTIRLDDWKTLLMTGRTGTVPRPADPMWQSQEEAETTGVTGAPLSGHAGGYASKLTAAQVSKLMRLPDLSPANAFFQVHDCASPVGRYLGSNCKARWHSGAGENRRPACGDHRLPQIC